MGALPNRRLVLKWGGVIVLEREPLLESVMRKISSLHRSRLADALPNEACEKPFDGSAQTRIATIALRRAWRSWWEINFDTFANSPN